MTILPLKPLNSQLKKLRMHQTRKNIHGYSRDRVFWKVHFMERDWLYLCLRLYLCLCLYLYISLFLSMSSIPTSTSMPVYVLWVISYGSAQ